MDLNQENKIKVEADDLNDLVIYGDESLIHIDIEHGFPAPMLSLAFYFNVEQNKQKDKLSAFIQDTKYHYPNYDIMKIDTIEVSTFANEVEEGADGKLQRDIGISKLGVLNTTIANYTMSYNLQEMIDWALTIIAYYKELIKEDE